MFVVIMKCYMVVSFREVISFGKSQNGSSFRGRCPLFARKAPKTSFPTIRARSSTKHLITFLENYFGQLVIDLCLDWVISVVVISFSILALNIVFTYRWRTSFPQSRLAPTEESFEDFLQIFLRKFLSVAHRWLMLLNQWFPDFQ